MYLADFWGVYRMIVSKLDSLFDLVNTCSKTRYEVEYVVRYSNTTDSHTVYVIIQKGVSRAVFVPQTHSLVDCIMQDGKWNTFHQLLYDDWISRQ